jgi:hypothetical protein
VGPFHADRVTERLSCKNRFKRHRDGVVRPEDGKNTEPQFPPKDVIDGRLAPIAAKIKRLK